MHRRDIYLAIDTERAYQDSKGVITDGHAHHHDRVECYILYMEDYMHEMRNIASRVWGETATMKTMEVMRKVITLGVAAAEIFGIPQRAGFEMTKPPEDAGFQMDPKQFILNQTETERAIFAMELLRSLPEEWTGVEYINSEHGKYTNNVKESVLRRMNYRLKGTMRVEGYKR